MSLFRAVVYLLMQRRVCLYIAYRGMAGSQLKKFPLMQRYRLRIVWCAVLNTSQALAYRSIELSAKNDRLDLGWAGVFFFCSFLKTKADQERKGSRMMKVLPPPGVSVTRIVPSKERTISLAMGRPRPKWSLTLRERSDR